MLGVSSQPAFAGKTDENFTHDLSKRDGPILSPGRERTLLCISPTGFSSALTAAIECEFRFLRVIVVADFGEASATLVANVDLIVVDRTMAGALAYHHEDLISWHRKASIAILADIDHQVDTRLTGLVERQIVQGVLPMNINLDILLSIFRILLSGGEYVPSALFRSQGTGSGQAARMRKDGAMSDLTAREWQILGHVAKGSQNKIIANDLGLSEHTVKIHIHNIINKLGVHNRTEAAAIYFAGKKGGGTDGNERDRPLS
ncbi:helix-turn-helix transcriptional regulator [Aliihoeflea sp. PC F10.4]